MSTGKVLIIVHDLHQDDTHFQSGPGYLAACLENVGANVEIYSQDVFHYPEGHLIKHLQDNEYDLILVGFLAARYVETVKSLLQTIAGHKKNAWLIVGGHGPAPISIWMLQNNPIDIVCMHESEITIVDIFKLKQSNPLSMEALSLVPGISYFNGRRVVTTLVYTPVKDLDTIPFPAWHLFPMEKYTNSLKIWGMDSGDKALSIVTSRGCTNKCSFCYRMESGIRMRSVQNIVDEMSTLYNTYGVNCYFIADELFVANKRRLIDFKDELHMQNLHIKYSCNARVDMFDEEIAQLLKDTGCTFVNIGFESTDSEVLSLMGKNATVEQNHKAAQICNDFGLAVGLNLLWNLPGDSKKSLQDNVDFIKKYTTHDQLRTVRPCTPYPGSPLYSQAIEKGLLKGPADFFSKFHNSDLITVNFTHIPIDEMYELLYKANKELIMDYCNHSVMTREAANRLISEFHTLYFWDHDYKFRGARHYDKKDM